VSRTEETAAQGPQELFRCERGTRLELAVPCPVIELVQLAQCGELNQGVPLCVGEASPLHVNHVFNNSEYME